MTEPLAMTLQERMMVLSLASKSIEMLEDPKAQMIEMNIVQWKALAAQTKPILARLDKAWPAMIPLPHDGVAWRERK